MGRVGDEIARMRMAKGLSQKQLAKQAGVAESYIADVEAGKRVMQDQLATRISKLLGGSFGPDVPESEAPVIGKTSATRPGATVRPAVRTPEPAAQLVYSTATTGAVADKPGAEGTNPIWSDAFGQMLKEVPVYDAAMRKQTGTRTMAVLAGKIEDQPKDKVFWLQAEDNDMIGYRIQRTDLVFCVQTPGLVEDGFYLVETDGNRLMRHLKAMPGGMIQLSCHKGAPVRETMPVGLVRVLGRMLRVEVRLP